MHCPNCNGITIFKKFLVSCCLLRKIIICWALSCPCSSRCIIFAGQQVYLQQPSWLSCIFHHYFTSQIDQIWAVFCVTAPSLESFLSARSPFFFLEKYQPFLRRHNMFALGFSSGRTRKKNGDEDREVLVLKRTTFYHGHNLFSNVLVLVYITSYLTLCDTELKQMSGLDWWL